MGRSRELHPPSARLAGLLVGDLAGCERLPDEGGRLCFAPARGAPVVEVAARIEKRFLGRTEIAVFETTFPVSWDSAFDLFLTHGGRLRRSGLAVIVEHGGSRAQRLADDLAIDDRLGQAAAPLDFTWFEIKGSDAGSRASLELMGASHVAMALPPTRSYIRLYPDQRDALFSTLTELGRVLRTVEGRDS